ncbi:hypothetical protein GCM10022222_80730 [Amycolatopsis ultiminotia]|uniref:Uncharacterized protein n=1 Tax=Amycolatopsis ultiminotia TaxID=543629 RepID=A0ABP6YHH2_9PSEU
MTAGQRGDSLQFEAVLAGTIPQLARRLQDRGNRGRSPAFGPVIHQRVMRFDTLAGFWVGSTYRSVLRGNDGYRRPRCLAADGATSRFSRG